MLRYRLTHAGIKYVVCVSEDRLPPDRRWIEAVGRYRLRLDLEPPVYLKMSQLSPISTSGFPSAPDEVVINGAIVTRDAAEAEERARSSDDNDA